MTRVGLLLIILIVALVISVLVVKSKLLLIKKIFSILFIVGIFFLIGNFINVNTISPEVEKIINSIKDEYDDVEVKTKGSSIYVKINDKWYDVEKMKIIGIFAKNTVIEYDGEKIKLNSPGIRNMLKTLKNFGIIK